MKFPILFNREGVEEPEAGIYYLVAADGILQVRIQHTRLKQLSLRRTLQGQQLQIARLRSPDQIADRINRLRLQVFAPDEIDQFANPENLNFALADD